MNNVKQYKCPECNKYGDAKSWDEETIKHYNEDENITSIEDSKNECYFYCPNCGLDINGEDIKINEIMEIDDCKLDIKTTIIKIIVNKLPKDCISCTLHEGDYCKIKGSVTGEEWIDLYSDSRDGDCPLEEN